MKRLFEEFSKFSTQLLMKNKFVKGFLNKTNNLLKSLKAIEWIRKKIEIYSVTITIFTAVTIFVYFILRAHC